MEIADDILRTIKQKRLSANGEDNDYHSDTDIVSELDDDDEYE